MQILNADKSSEYFDSPKDEREDSAVRVIHWAWVEHSSTLGRMEHLEPASPLDMLILYQAAAATFRDWPAGTARGEKLEHGGRIINREVAERRLKSVPVPKQAVLATRFANQVIALSESAAAEQDLNYYVDLFLRCVNDERVLDGIMNGSLSRESKQLTDLNRW